MSMLSGLTGWVWGSAAPANADGAGTPNASSSPLPRPDNRTRDGQGRGGRYSTDDGDSGAESDSSSIVNNRGGAYGGGRTSTNQRPRGSYGYGQSNFDGDRSSRALLDSDEDEYDWRRDAGSGGRSQRNRAGTSGSSRQNSGNWSRQVDGDGGESSQRRSGRTAPPDDEPRSAFSKCVICKTKPPYQDAERIYPTCGNKCRLVLKTRCEICYERPKLGNYPTCGNTCAAKLKTLQSLCIQCRAKPRADGSDENGPYRFCGRTCRDASRRGAPLPPSADPRNVNPLDGRRTRRLTSDRPPCFVEVEEGSIRYNRVVEMFEAGGRRAANVLGVYKFNQSAGVTQAQDEYAESVRNSQDSARWVRLTRKCRDMSSGGVTKPCDNRGCGLCCVLKSNVFNDDDFPRAVCVSGRVDRSNTLPSTSRRRSEGVKVLMFAKVVSAANAPRMSEEDAYVSQGRGRSPDVVQLLENGRLSDQLLVFNTDAIKPQYVILYQ